MYNLPDPLPFYKIVWEIVRQVPAGTATTFGQIASMIPAPEGVDPADYDRLGPRWVGDAMNAVSRVDEPTVPWHRVINAKGAISLPETSKGAAIQRARLRAEGIFQESIERVDLNENGWDGPPEAWLNEHDLLPPRTLKKQPPTDDNPQQMSLF